jgi:hypothetical protein
MWRADNLLAPASDFIGGATANGREVAMTRQKKNMQWNSSGARTASFIPVLAAVAYMTAAHVSAGWPACERHRITNMHYSCVNPGAQCGATKRCKEVSGWLWKNCKCRCTRSGR